MDSSNPSNRQLTIVSGGQTGVDQAALSVAVQLGIPHGGWCPLGRLCETGTIPRQYQLTEMPTKDYRSRTRQNVTDSDGTLILYRERLTGGTYLTQQFAVQTPRPLFLFDLHDPVPLQQAWEWIEEHQISVLNVAGPRESTAPGVFTQAREILAALLVSPRR